MDCVCSAGRPRGVGFGKAERQESQDGGAVKVSERFSSRMLEVVENVAESFSDKLLKVQPVHKSGEAKLGEQKG
jgi:hypothetical protein